MSEEIILWPFICGCALAIAYLALIFWPRKTTNTLSYHPRHDRIIVKRLPVEAPTPGQVFLPNSQRKPVNRGTVVAVGPGKRNPSTGRVDVIDLKPGDQVEFFDFANTVDIDGEEYLLLRDEECWGKRVR